MPAKWTNRGDSMGEGQAVKDARAAQAAKVQLLRL